MRMALDLAKKARGRTSPNPMVGAVLVKGDEVKGVGFHARAGMPHAEIEAIRDAGGKAGGCDLYVNLEPCAVHGRTPPCAEALIREGIKRVYVGMTDPNPLASGAGIEKLRDAGIEVRVGILEKESRRLNEVFIKYITTKRPFVILKSAASLDGKIATPDGLSKWITGPEARTKVHEIRDQVDAVMVGSNTVLRDNPSLTARLSGRETKNPLRIALDSGLSIPDNSKLLKVDAQTPTLIATTKKASEEKIKELEQKGVAIIQPGETDGRVDIDALMDRLGEMEITSLLIEGGSEVNSSALRAGIVDKVVFFYAPKIIGGTDSIPMFGHEGIRDLAEAVRIEEMEMSRIGEDIMVTGYVHGDH